MGAHLDAVEQYRRALRHADGVTPPERATLLAGLAYECYLTDKIEEAVAARLEALAIWESAGEAVRIGETHRWLSRLRWFDGRNDLSARHATLGEPQRIGPVTAASREIAWITADPATARDLATEVWPTITGDSSSWRRGSVATWLARPPGADVRPAMSPYVAELDGRWEDAAAEWETLGSPFAQALASARSETRDSLARAAQIFDRIGATAAAARARSISRSHGWAPPRGLRPTTRAHPAGLTQREEQVLVLVAEGLSDAAIAERLVLSARTVEHHVSSILAKLGVTSRHQAVAAANPGTGRREIG